MALATTTKRRKGTRYSTRLDMDAVRREFYPIRAMAALRQGLATDRVDWRIEPHWDGFTVYGDPGDPLIMPIIHLHDDDENLVAIGENFQTVGFISDLSDADREWYSGLVRIERDRYKAERKDRS